MMPKLIASLLLIMLGACSIEQAVRRNEDQYTKPGWSDPALTEYYDTYRIPLLDQQLITHQWPVAGDGCRYRGPGQLYSKEEPYKGGSYMAYPIYEADGKTWQRFPDGKGFDFSRYTRSVKTVSKAKGEEGKEIELGLQAICSVNWQQTSHYFLVTLFKQSLEESRAKLIQHQPLGRWSERRVGSNKWFVQEVAEQNMTPRPPNGVGGIYHSWILPVGTTGYTLQMRLGASQESLQNPQAHERMKATFMHMIETVKVEPFRP